MNKRWDVMSAPEVEHTARLILMVRSSPWFMRILEAVREVGLPNWCVGAGALRNLVWDELHGKAEPSALADVDVAFFDPGDLSRERDQRIQVRLAASMPGVPWEVTNQAGVHLWFESVFGHAVAPLRSLEEAVASWPEFATSVGVHLDGRGQVSVIAPHGLADLFEIVIRRNPTRVSADTYRRRVEQKRYSERWPRVRVMP